MKQRYFIELSYNGTRFHGWQVQPNAVSVQQMLEVTLSTMCRETVAVTGAGRTDTGVHAAYFVAHIDSEQESLDQPDFIRKINRFLNNDVAVLRITKVGPEAHARFDAKSRTYCYFIHQQKDPFLQETSWYHPVFLHVERMNEACTALLGRHDFTSFSKLHTDVKTNNCDVFDANWTKEGHRLTFTITADRFLRNMVRAIVGTMVLVGRGKITPEDFHLIIESRNRGLAGASAPPEGLFLTGITYPPDVFNAVHRR
ncbi:MAG: tRNA pseudouridine(38-40) synthase TruA [Prolixibacteraceae bacterium]